MRKLSRDRMTARQRIECTLRGEIPDRVPVFDMIQHIPLIEHVTGERLTLANGQQTVACYAIVDSGADNCVFPLTFVQPLGLDPLLTSAESTSGVGSYAVPTFFWDIVVHLHGTPISFPGRAGFTDGPNRIGLGLLGQDGFFNRFGVRFDLCRSASFEIEVP